MMAVYEPPERSVCVDAGNGTNREPLNAAAEKWGVNRLRQKYSRCRVQSRFSAIMGLEDTMTLADYLTRDADGYIHVTGHRIGLQDVVHYYNEGYSPEALLDAFPTLTLPLIHRIIAFYLENQADVDTYIAVSDAQMQQQGAVAQRGPDLAELRRRFAAKQATKA